MEEAIKAHAPFEIAFVLGIIVVGESGQSRPQSHFIIEIALMLGVDGGGSHEGDREKKQKLFHIHY